MSELYIAAAVFMFAIGMMITGQNGAPDLYQEVRSNRSALVVQPVAGEMVNSQAMGTITTMWHQKEAQSYARQLTAQVGSQTYRNDPVQSLRKEHSHWVILTDWQEYKDGAFHLETLPVAAEEGYKMVAATYSFTHSGDVDKPGQPIRISF